MAIPQMRIVLKATHGKPITPKVSKEWSQSCRKLKKALSRGAMNLGSSPFDKIDCENKVRPSNSPPKTKTPFDHWSLSFDTQINSTNRQTIVVLSRNSAGSDVTLYSKAFESEKGLLASLSDQDIANAFADVVITRMPFVAKIRPSNDAISEIEADIPETSLSEILIGEPRLNKGIWELHILNSLVRTSKDASTFRLRKPFSILGYKANKNYAMWPIVSKSTIQNLADKRLTEELEKKGVFTWLLDGLSVGSSRGTFRFGLPLIKDDTIFSRAQTFSMMIELKSGFFEGFRWFWDMAPEAEQPAALNTNLKESLTWSRAALGYAFVFDTPVFLSSIFDQLELIAKIGLLDFDATYAIGSSFGFNETSSFHAKNATDFGLELGVLGSSTLGDYRLSAATNLASAKLSLTGSTTEVLSYRGAVEFYFFASPLGPMQIQLATFLSGEKVFLEDISSSDPTATLSIRKIDFVQGFAGIGGSLSW